MYIVLGGKGQVGCQKWEKIPYVNNIYFTKVAADLIEVYTRFLVSLFHTSSSKQRGAVPMHSARTLT